ncbi:MAG: thioredoxin [Candidatus Helarchaeota archaeon]|nr:thioredoxin [Candidatus Helarchaeota archaeon]
MDLEFTDENFQKEVLESEKPVLIDFWAEWCAPCSMLAPIIEEISNEYRDKIKVGRIDVDKNPNTAVKYGIRSIPSLLFFKDGKVEEQLIGYQSKNNIIKKLSIE